jgi:hypothetical protein
MSNLHARSLSRRRRRLLFARGIIHPHHMHHTGLQRSNSNSYFGTHFRTRQMKQRIESGTRPKRAPFDKSWTSEAKDCALR